LKNLPSDKKEKIKQLLRTAEACLIHNQVDKAEAISRQVIAIDHDNVEALYFLGEALCKLRKFQESLKVLKQANKLSPHHPRITHLVGWVMFMNGYINLGRDYIQKSLKALPYDVQILCDLAVIEMSQDKGKEAKEYALKALEIDPTNPLTQEVFQKALSFDNARTRSKKKMPN